MLILNSFPLRRSLSLEYIPFLYEVYSCCTCFWMGSKMSALFNISCSSGCKGTYTALHFFLFQQSTSNGLTCVRFLFTYAALLCVVEKGPSYPQYFMITVLVAAALTNSSTIEWLFKNVLDCIMEQWLGQFTHLLQLLYNFFYSIFWNV